MSVVTQAVRDVLSWYDGERPGVKASLARLLTHGRMGGSGKLVILPVDQLDSVAVLLRPHEVHPQQHLGPVVGVRAAVAGVDREEGAGAVVRAVQQGPQLEILEQLLDPLDLAGDLGGERLVR